MRPISEGIKRSYMNVFLLLFSKATDMICRILTMFSHDDDAEFLLIS